MANPASCKSEALYAAIDLGSNSFHMLICQRHGERVEALNRVRKKVRLAEGLSEDNELSVDAMERGWQCLRVFAEQLADIPTENIIIVATATLRLATNRQDFIRVAKSILRHDIDIISGEKEAGLIYQGATQGARSQDSHLIIDIGGASTEIVHGKGCAPTQTKSVDIGCVTFMQRYFPNGELGENNFTNAVQAAKDAIFEVSDAYQGLNWQYCLGASGTPQAIREIALANNDVRAITLEQLERIGAAIGEAKNISSLTIEGLQENRRAVFPAGIAILKALFETLKINKMELASGALREGLIAQLTGDKNEAVWHQQLASKYSIDQPQAQRVLATATELMSQNKTLNIIASSKLLDLVCRYHEIGVFIDFKKHYQHAVYLLKSINFPGLDINEKRLLVNAIRNQGEHIQTIATSEQQALEQALVGCLRLAKIFCHRRDSSPSLDADLSIDDKGWHLVIKHKDWQQSYPLLAFALGNEQQEWRKIGWQLNIE